MASDVGVKLGVDGEKAFNDSLKAVNAQIKSLGAEMTAVTATFAKNADSQQALAAKNEVLGRSIEATKAKISVLNKEIESQKAKLDGLGEALEKAAREFGQNSKEALQAQNEYNKQSKKVSDLTAQLHRAEAELANMTNAVEENSQAMDGSGKNMEELADGAKKAGDSLDAAGKAGLSFGDVLKANILSDFVVEGARKLADALKAVSGAMVDLAKQSLGGFSDFEQLSGGIETLFGAGGKSLEEYAQSMGKSVDKVSGEYERLMASQQAVFANAENAFKTAGLSANEYMETVTGFSASLLQSLGGDTEKAAQVADQALTDMADNANKMGTDMDSIQHAYQGFAKQNYTMLDNLKLGYGGTKEEMQRLLADAKKLSGVKYNISSFSDIVEAIHVVQTEIGITGTTALEAATTIEGSTNSMKAAWSNLVTGLARDDADLSGLMGNFVQGVETVGQNVLPRVQTILENMGSLIEQVVPEMAAQIPPLLEQVVPPLVEAGGKLLAGLGSGLAQAAPQLLEQAQTALTGLRDTFLQLVPTLAQGLQEKTPEFIASGLELLMGLSASLRENVGLMVDAALALVKSLAQGIADGIPDIIEKGPQIVSNLANTINDNAPKILQAAFDMIVTLGKGLLEGIPTLVKNIPQIISAIVDVFSAFNWVNLGKTLMTGLGTGIKNMVSGIKNIAAQVKDAITGGLAQLPQELLSIGKNAVQGMINGIKGALSGVKDAAKNLAGGLVSTVKNALGIHSPSTLFRDEVGQYISLGVAEGIEGSSDKAVKAADKLAKDVYTRSKEWADRQTKYLNLSFEDQLELWETIQSQFIQGSKQYAQAEEKIYDLKEKYQSEYYDSLKTKAERQAKYQKANLSEQLATWRSIQDQFIQDSKQYAEAEEKIMDLRAQVQEEFYGKVEDANKRITELQENYYDTMEKRQNEIASAYGLFDSVSAREELSGKDLLRNLQDQVSVMRAFYKGLDELSSRGVGDAIVEEIRAMGPSAEDELHALLGLTDRELDQYADIYMEKQQLANRVAIEELKDLKKQTDAEISSQIDDLRAYYNQNAPELGMSFADGLAEGMMDGMSTVRRAAQSLAQTAMAPLSGLTDFSYTNPVADIADTMTSSGGKPNNYDEAKEFLEMAAEKFANRPGELITLGELQQAFAGAVSGMEVTMDGRKVGRVTNTYQDYDNKAYGR